jgi:xanthine phosphoribosyltransferase
MDLLSELITRDGKHLGNGVLKVDSFMNHQIDPQLMRYVGERFAKLFAGTKPTRILTAETSGIAPALAAGMALNVPILFARKHQPITMAPDPYREQSSSPTHGKPVELIVSTEYLESSDRVLIIDDFLASARTILALQRLVEQSGATLVGVGAVIEKEFQKGRDLLSHLNVPIESLAVIERFERDRIIVKDAVTTP